ncbi:serine hydrolase domain-containing protein [Paenibacillus sp. PL2-23]|uniref:serine hydrolase domain-containing protein n=1 Tax=Paenibacillus sp. PL2-23 TaxID=2100729 RepID=UPI0030F84362
MEQAIGKILKQSRVSRFSSKPNHRLAIGLIQNGRLLIWSDGQPIAHMESEDAYEIGSLTKTMTGLLLAIGERKGYWSATDSLAELVPEWSASPFAQAATLHQLVTHTSHLPRIPANFRETVTDKLNPYSNYKEEHLAAAVLAENKKPSSPKHLYSNYGFGLLGWILARRLGLSLGELLQEHILKPLGMNATKLRAREQSSTQSLPPVFNAKGSAVPHWDFHEAMAGAGAVCSTMPDMLRYIQAQLGQADEALHLAIQHSQKEHHPLLKSRGIGVGYAWMFYKEKDGSTTYWHNGGTYGSTSFLSFNPQHGAGFVILSNYGTDIRSQLPLIGINRMNVDKLARIISADLYRNAKIPARYS